MTLYSFPETDFHSHWPASVVPGKFNPVNIYFVVKAQKVKVVITVAIVIVVTVVMALVITVAITLIVIVNNSSSNRGNRW